MPFIHAFAGRVRRVVPARPASVLRLRAPVLLLLASLAACQSSSAPPFDYCDGESPPDAACYASTRAPTSDNIALALEIADAQIAREAAEEIPWSWGEAVMMYGFIELYRVTGEQRLLQYMQDWIDHHIDEGYPLGTNDQCPPALTAMLLYEETGEERYRAVVLDVLDYLANEALRTDFGGINHLGVIDVLGLSIWLDSLFMFGTVVTRWTEITGEREHIGLYEEQLEIFVEELEERPGLLRHAEGWRVPQEPDVYWARGNAWVAASNVEYLRVRLARGESAGFAQRLLDRQLAAYIETQDADSGRWWTIMNRPGELYEETSASALFGYSMARAWRYGLAGDEVLGPMEAALDGVLERIVRDPAGVPVVTGISGPTNVAVYDVALVDDINYGLGATILLLVETSGLTSAGVS